MPLAPTTMPSPPQSVTSVVSTMLTVTTCPQLTAVGTGAAPTVHDQVAGVASELSAASTARTSNVCAPTATVRVVGEVHSA